MKQQSYLLKIENPCRENWSAMTKMSHGKHCSQCSKTVLDFTQLTDGEITRLIRQHPGKLCGRFTQDQLNRKIKWKEPTNNAVLNKLLVWLLLVLTGKGLSAAHHKNMERHSVSIADNKAINLPFMISESEPATDSLKNIIQGIVFDAKTKKPLPFCDINIKDTRLGTTTDEQGRYKFMIPDEFLKDKINLIMNHVGYEKSEVVINKTDLPITKDFAIMASEIVTMGMVVVVKKKKWWRLKNKRSH